MARPAYRSKTKRKKIASTLRMALSTYARHVNDDTPDGVLLMIAELTNQLVRLEYGVKEMPE